MTQQNKQSKEERFKKTVHKKNTNTNLEKESANKSKS